MNTIQATELRIDNFIETSNGIETVKGILVEINASIGSTFTKVYTQQNKYFHIEGINPIPLNEDWLVRLGGEKLPYHNILNSIFFKVGRNRIVSVGNVGTPNEMIWLCQVNATNDKIIDDLICLRNYDYDGYTPVHTFQNLIHALTGTELTLTDK